MTYQPILEESQKAQFKFKKKKRPKVIPIAFLPEGVGRMPVTSDLRLNYRKTVGREEYWAFVEADGLHYTDGGVNRVVRLSVYLWNTKDKTWTFHSTWNENQEPILT